MELLILAWVVAEVASGGWTTATVTGAVGGAAKELAGETAKGYRQWNGRRTAKLAGSRGGRAWLAVESVAAGGARAVTHGGVAAGRGAWRGQKTARAKRHDVRRRAVAVMREKVTARRAAAEAPTPEPPESPAIGGADEETGDEVTDQRLQSALADEDEEENRGRLIANERETCHTCKAWATEGHLESAEHKRRIGVPEDWRFDPREGRFRPVETSPATDGEGSTTPTGTPSSGGANVADMDTEKAPAVLQAWRRLAKEVEAQVEADDTNGWALPGDQDALESVKAVLAAKEADLAQLVEAAEGTKNQKAEQFRE